MITQKVTITVGGREYEGWKTVAVTKSVLNFAGTFSITTKTKKDFPFFVGQQTEIFIEGKKVITGYIDKISRTKTEKAHDLVLSGNDRTVDLTQSTTDANLSFKPNNMTLKQVIEKALRDANLSNIKVIDEIGNIKPFTNKEYVDSVFGQAYFDFIETYARIKGVLLTTNGDGNIVITRTSDQKVMKTIIDNDNDSTRLNVQSLDAEIDYSQLFYEYICTFEVSDVQRNAAKNDPKNFAGLTGNSIDKEIRKSRVLNFQSEYATDSLSAKDRAIWQKNYNLSKAISLSYDVDGFIPRNDPDMIWEPNYLVILKDKEMLRSDSRMLIKTVKYSYELQGGSTSTLTLTDALALTLQSERQQSNADEHTPTALYYRNGGQ